MPKYEGKLSDITIEPITEYKLYCTICVTELGIVKGTRNNAIAIRKEHFETTHNIDKQHNH